MPHLESLGGGTGAPGLRTHVIVVGHGRSGTNMVLDLFDCHPGTFCRNEPNELVGTAFAGLGDEMFPEPEPDDFAGRWCRAVARTIRACGARDRFATDKAYFQSLLRARLGQALMARRTFRTCVLPRIAGRTVEEWPCPRLYYDRAALDRTLPVLKILLTPAWILRAHALVDTQRVVHVVRRPQGFVQSWWSRYVTGIGGGPEKVFADNQPSLARIRAHFGQEPARPEPYSLERLIVSEVWRWRYVNEILLDGLSDSSRYLKLDYEKVMRDQEGWAERVYAFADLEMTPASRQTIRTMENTLFGARKSDGLDPRLVSDAVEQVMADSPLRAALLGADPARTA